MNEVNVDEPFVTDTLASIRYPIYTRANAVDVWPGAMSPFNTSTQTSFLFERAWRNAYIRVGAFTEDDFDEAIPEIMGKFHGYTYLNLSVQRVFGVRMPGLDPETMTTAFLGSAEDVPPYEPDPRDENPECSARIGKTIEWILGTTALPHLDEQRREVEQLRAERPDFKQMSDRELFDYALPFVTTRFEPLIEEHLFITTAGSIPIGVVQATAAAVGEPGLAMRLLSGLGGVDSAAPTFEMWGLGRMVAGSSIVTAAFDAGPDGLLGRLRGSGEQDAQDFVASFDGFLSRFGSRCSNEWDLGERDWELDPFLPLSMIDRMRLQPESASPIAGADRLATDRVALIADVAAKLEGEAKALFLAAVAAAKVFLPARERTKATCVLLLQMARHALQELGARMVAAGHFREVDDFTLLRAEEFDAFLAAPAEWTAEIERRRQWTSDLNDLEPPFLFVGKPSPPSTWKRREVKQLAPVTPGEVIVGASGCQGVATGIARVLKSPSDGGELEPGEVLVAEATDPGWTPLFVSAAAVVVDTGAALSHAAIVSRELGVPCVVSATHASRRIPDGARITVDGTTGTVTVVSV